MTYPPPSDSRTSKVVLMSVAPGNTDAVSTALATVLALPPQNMAEGTPEWVLEANSGVIPSVATEIARNTPIAIFAGLARVQALAVIGAMARVSEAGAVLKVIAEDDASMADINQIDWQDSPPPVDGLPLGSYGSGV